MEGLNTALGVVALVVFLVILGYLVFAKRKVNELQYRWETGRWPRSESDTINALNHWEDEQDVSGLDAEIARTNMEIDRVSEDYRQKRKNLGALSVTREVIGQLEERQKSLLSKRKRKTWLASIAKPSATPSPALAPPDDNQPVNGKVSESGRLVAASKS